MQSKMTDARRHPARVVLLAAVAALACGRGLEAEMPLQGTHWRLTEAHGSPVEVQVGQREPYIVFEPDEDSVTDSEESKEQGKGRLNGTGGCNRISGPYTNRGQSLAIGLLISTRMACPEPIMNVENALLAALEKADRYRIDGHILELYVEESVLARFAAAEP